MKRLQQIVLIFALFNFCFIGLLAQEEINYFNKTYYTDTTTEATHAILPIEGGYLTVGNFTDVYSRKCFLRFLNEKGDKIWTKVIGDTLYQIAAAEGRTFIQTSDDHFVFGGFSRSAENPVFIDMQAIKFNLAGEIIWDYKFGSLEANENCHYVHETKDKGILLSGFRQPFEEDGSPDAANFLIIKLDSLGNYLWDKEYSNVNDAAYSGVETSDGGQLFAGRSLITGSLRTDSWIIKTDSSGEIEWELFFGEEYEDYCAVTAIEYEIGKYVVSGCYEENGVKRASFYLLNEFGDVEFEYYHQDSDYILFKYLDYRESTNSFFFNALSFDSNTSVYIGEITLEGEVLWDKHLDIEGVVQVYLRDAEACDDGGYVLAGFTNGSEPQRSWVVKVDSLGNTCWDISCDSTATIVSIPEISLDSEIKISPNPASDYLNLQVPLEFDTFQFVLFDVMGRRVISINNQSSFSLPDHLNGIYFWEVYSDDSRIRNGKLLIE